jgi:hypothetical protein
MQKLIVKCSTLWTDFNSGSVESFNLDRTMSDTIFNLQQPGSVI